MPKKKKPARDTWEAQCDEVADEFWPEALRLALDGERAFERCSRRACKVAGSCRIFCTRGTPLECGGGLTDSAIEKAAFAVAFICAVSVPPNDAAEAAA